jgi:hypothetical protein
MKRIEENCSTGKRKRLANLGAGLECPRVTSRDGLTRCIGSKNLDPNLAPSTDKGLGNVHTWELGTA